MSVSHTHAKSIALKEWVLWTPPPSDINMDKARVRLNYLHWFLMGGRLEHPQEVDLIGGCG